MQVAKKRRYVTTSILAVAGSAVLAAALLTAARGDADEPAAHRPKQPVANGPATPKTPVIAEPPPVPEPPAPVPQVEPAKPKPRPQIDVVFALDTTGSMGGLIAGAKQKIWSLANTIASGQPRPIVRFGLVGYRDRTDAYVTQVVPLTSDMDSLYEHLMAFQAGGGGDTPEDVNSALSAAINKMQWGDGQNVLKLVFLVGDAPPHEDYDGPSSKQLARRARAKGILINTIRCGLAADTERAWKSIARIAGGDYHSIGQSGGMVAVSTPYDADLERLNRELAGTGLSYGSARRRAKMDRKKAARMSMKAEVAASAAGYSARSRAGLGDGDLIAGVTSGRVDLDKLGDDALPEEMREMSKDERHELVAKKRAERAEIQKKILALSKKRDAWLKKRKPAKGKRSFDRRVMHSVATEAADVGVAY